jgi:hypothetical protein
MFSNNHADSGKGDDIDTFGSGTVVTIHPTCPSEYAANALQLGALDTHLASGSTINGPKLSLRCFSCDTGFVFSGDNAAPCMPCPEGEPSAPDWMMCGACAPGSGRAASLTECETCPSGKFSDTNDLSFCTLCPTGRFNPDTNSTSPSACLPCDAGRYRKDPGGSACSLCPPGTFAATTGTVLCDQCASGKFTPKPGYELCENCPLGSFVSSTGSKRCHDCAIGRYADATGTVECRDCGRGYFNDATSSTSSSACVACPSGFYSSVNASATCDGRCPIGRFNELPGAPSLSHCLDCPGGKFNPSLNASSCVDCATGKFSPAIAAFNETTCTECALGKQNEILGAASPTDCKMCVPGKYGDTRGSAECKYCSLGKYGPSYEAIAESYCIDCVATKTSSEDFSNCVCASGFLSDELTGTCACSAGLEWKAGSCFPCLEGFFKPDAGLDLCTACNTFVTGSTVTAALSSSAESSSDTVVIATSVENCACPMFSFLRPVEAHDGSSLIGECTECPEGTRCDRVGVKLHDLPVLDGFWRSHNESYIVLPCKIEEACHPHTVNETFNPCADGHTGALCSLCESGFALVSGSCQVCDDGTSLSALIGIIALCVVPFVAAFLAYKMLWKRTEAAEAGDEEGGREEEEEEEGGGGGGADGEEEQGANVSILPNTERAPSRRRFRPTFAPNARVSRAISRVRQVSIQDLKSWKPAVKSVLQYIQIVAMLDFSLNLKFPRKFSATKKAFGFANFDIITILPFGCYMSTNHHDKLVMYTTIPMVFSATMLLIFWVFRNNEKRKSLANSAFSAFLSVNSFILPMLTSLIFSTYPCKTFDDGRRLLMIDLSVDCDSEEHAKYVAYANSMVVLFVLGVPSTCHFLLWKHSDLIKRPVEERSKDERIMFMAFLFESYEPQCWWMETVEMCRRILMTGGLVLIYRGSAEQVVIALLISAVSVRVVARYKPFRVARGGAVNVNNNHLAESMQWQLVATLVCCLLLRFIEVGGEEASDNAVFGKGVLDSILVEIQFNTFLFMLYRLLKSTVLKRWGWGWGGGREGGRGRGVVVPVAEEDEEGGGGGGGEDEAEVFLLRSQLSERDNLLRERDSAMLREREAAARERQNAVEEVRREVEGVLREKDEVIRGLREGGDKEL